MTTATVIKRAGNSTKMPAMSQAEFDAISKLMRLNDSAYRRAAEMVLVQGKTAKEAAEANGITLLDVYMTFIGVLSLHCNSHVLVQVSPRQTAIQRPQLLTLFDAMMLT
jgi:hypothetical protein